MIENQRRGEVRKEMLKQDDEERVVDLRNGREGERKSERRRGKGRGERLERGEGDGGSTGEEGRRHLPLGRKPERLLRLVM